jgi:hypothetical protein
MPVIKKRVKIPNTPHLLIEALIDLTRIHLNQFRHLNLISSTDFWLCTDSYARRNKVLATSSIFVRTLKIYSYIPTL